MSHGPSTLTVSVSEAQRLESETRTRLLKAQKLSLIVDLDQTIVHATVDPTVGEWMADPSNPNWPALQGVSRFQLNDPPSLSNEGCYYYLKQRPGLADFLHSLADKYEMHVYTMGTRAYADAVCKIIDPTGEIFSDRILSRDESGSMTQKSITRLFPVDTSMVVIIDDRGDVWEYSPNLVSVLPYNFFVGIGDINGAFLPPARPLEPPPPTQPEAAAPASAPKDPIAVLPVMTVTDDAGATSALAKGEQPGGASEGAAGGAGPTRETIAAVHAGETSAAPPPSTVQAPDTASAPLPAETTTSEELAKSARSKLIADQVLSRPLKQKQIALTQHEQAKRKAGAAHRRRSQPSSVATRGSQTGAESTTSSRAVTPVPPILPSSSPSSSSSSSAASSSAVCPPEDAAPPHLTSSPDPGPPSSLPLKPAALDSDSADDSDTNTDLSLDEFDDNQLLRGPERPVLVDHDTELSRLQTILGDIHSGFYSQDSIEEADARMVISAIKHDVLHGTHLAFSSLWPMEAVSQQQYAWKLAEQFGACCYTHLSPKVTHLVAAKLGTSKVNQALSRPNVAIVGPKWLYDAALLWTRPAEARYTWRVGPHAASSEPSEPGAGGGGGGGEGEGEEEGEGGIQEEWGMGAADWQEATAEVMAALDESDDDEDSLDDRSSASSDLHRPPRKRSRTPSNRDPSRPPSRPSDDPLLRTHGQPDAPAADSPLSKRKRIARSRSSKLKLVVPLIDNPSDPPEQSVLNPASAGSCDQPRQANSPDGLLVKPLDLSSVDQLSPEDDEFLSALAAEMEGNMNS
ncbi:hypothetical protein PtA15_3A506 [Puccinia triticina]|nr:uncharacterized protein PtA15_3A506 [Puccinia triticina]WAQ83139.1 hypothetical protein PtA15_3A506 [Puccinia triticina]WAR53979.1 hypothetical protein PtB15_3B489 [Puccinia triticina]